MNLFDLPPEIFRQIIKEYVTSTTHQSDLKNLQLVNKFLHGEVTRAVCTTGRLFNFANPEPYFPEYLRYMFYGSNRKDDYLARTIKHVTDQLIKYDTSEQMESSERIPLVVSRAAIDFMVHGLRRVMEVGSTKTSISPRRQSLRYVNRVDECEFDRSMRLGAGQTWDATEHILSVAAYAGNISLVEHLLGQKDADLNARSNIFGPPLRNAALKGHVEIFKLLLDKGADADGGCYPRTEEDYRIIGETRRETLFFSHHLPCSYTRPGTALQAAARFGHKEIVQLLLRPEFHISRSSHAYRDAIIFAAWGGNADVLKMLIECADFSMFDTTSIQVYWDRMLRLAAVGGKTETMSLLLEKGAYINNKGRSMNYATPLGIAAFYGHNETILFLLQKGADINAGAACPIYMAARHGFSCTTRLLLDKGAQINPVGYRCIKVATKEGYADVVRVLAEKGLHHVRIRTKADENKHISLLEFAKSLGHQRVVRVLEEFGVTE